MVEDAELLRRYTEEKSETAFAELVQRNVDLVYSAARRRLGGDAHAAADVTQQVFSALARRAGELSRGVVLPAWLYNTTRNLAVDLVRAERRRRAREQEAQLMHDSLANHKPNADWERLRPLLDATMDELGGRDREAVVLRYFARQTFGEIGRTLKLSEDAARMRVDRALEKLRTLLARRGVTSTASALGAVLSAGAVAAAPVGLTSVVCDAALGQAGVAGAGAGILTFMTTNKFVALVAVGFALLAVGTATREALAERANVAALAAAIRETDGLAARLSALQRRAQDVEAESAQLQRNLENPRTLPGSGQAPPGNPAATKTGATPAEQLEAGEAFLSRHPEFKEALVERSYARVAARFRPLYRSLNLTSDQIARFENLLIEGEGVNMGSPDSNGQMILRPGKGLSRAEVESGVRELLGEAGYQRYQEASRLVGPRGFALQVAGALYFTDTPLTASQSDQLAGIVDAVQAEMGRSRGSREDYWNSVMNRAQGILGPAQLAALAGFQQREQFDAELNRLKGSWQLPGWESKAKPAK